jgi:uncharacterized protein with PQ loop repeat
MIEVISEVLGWIGAACFSVCAIPQALHCYRTKSAAGLSRLTLGLWLTGEISLLGYTLLGPFSLQLLVNYVFNLLCLCVIIYYKIKERNK